MRFVQTIGFTTSRIDELQKMVDEYEQQQAAASPGYLRSWILKDRDRENAYMVSVEFESPELAMQNSARPETDQWAKTMQSMVDGEVEYRNFDLISGPED